MAIKIIWFDITAVVNLNEQINLYKLTVTNKLQHKKPRYKKNVFYCNNNREMLSKPCNFPCLMTVITKLSTVTCRSIVSKASPGHNTKQNYP